MNYRDRRKFACSDATDWLAVGLIFYFIYGKSHRHISAPPPEMLEGIKLTSAEQILNKRKQRNGRSKVKPSLFSFPSVRLRYLRFASVRHCKIARD